MYLTRLRFDPASPATQRLLADPYRLHEVILLGFDPAVRGGDPRVLYRVEPEMRDAAVSVLVQSQGEPRWQSPRVSKRLDGVVVDGPKVVELDLMPGQRLRFRLRANPTKRTVQGKRIAITGESGQMAWLRRKLEAAGAEVVDALGRDEGMLRSRRARGGETEMSFVSVLYQGVLRITAPAAVHDAVSSGIGSGKAFGFGLLSLSRA